VQEVQLQKLVLQFGGLGGDGDVGGEFAWGGRSEERGGVGLGTEVLRGGKVLLEGGECGFVS
jgi:hypothetical protein